MAAKAGWKTETMVRTNSPKETLKRRPRATTYHLENGGNSLMRSVLM